MKKDKKNNVRNVKLASKHILNNIKPIHTYRFFLFVILLQDISKCELKS